MFRPAGGEDQPDRREAERGEGLGDGVLGKEAHKRKLVEPGQRQAEEHLGHGNEPGAAGNPAGVARRRLPSRSLR
jgi:hypothetical protein